MLFLLLPQAPDKVSLSVAVSDELVKRGISAGVIAKEAAVLSVVAVVGRPQLAQAGGKNPSKITEAIAYVKQMLAKSGGSA